MQDREVKGIKQEAMHWVLWKELDWSPNYKFLI